MELAIFVLIFVLGVSFVKRGLRKLVFRKSRRKSKGYKNRRHRKIAEKPFPHQTNKPQATQKFDEASSRHLETRRMLAGRAFVVDGDTIRIGNTQIRLSGIDAPELNHPYGQNAKWTLHKICKGQKVRAEITDEDQYGRAVAYCFLPDGRDLSGEMVKMGLALDWKKYSGGKYAHLESADSRKKLFLADARQKGHMGVWRKFENRTQSD